VILICTYFEKMNFVTISDLQENIFHRLVYFIGKNYFPILCWTNYVIEQN
jgi:hypothetical protein